jgi:cystathionine beta-lyase/cystathionine gamma-synthase
LNFLPEIKGPSMDIETSEETICARGGWAPDFVTRPSSPPVYMTTAFDLDGLEQLDDIASSRVAGYIYTRDGNPNHEAFASDLARLEGAESAVVCSSGMGAMTAVLLAHVKSGDHVIAAKVLYGRTGQMLNQLQSQFGVQVTFVDALNPTAFQQAVTPNTKLAIIENISNPLMEVADVPAIVATLGEVPLLVDSTFATPILQKPISLGAQIVFHSASKYLNGHGDVMMGVVAGKLSTMRKVKAMMALFGMNSNPYECWLASRGLRTLPIRMERVSRSAAELSLFLQSHPKIRGVYYPGLEQHPTHAIAKKLLPGGFGGMVAFELNGGRDSVAKLFRSLGEIPFSPTLADARTTVSYPTGTSHKFMTAADREALGIRDGLVRLSVGLEDVHDLQHELETAFNAV